MPLTASAPAVSTARYGGPPARQRECVGHPTANKEAIWENYAVKGFAWTEKPCKLTCRPSFRNSVRQHTQGTFRQCVHVNGVATGVWAACPPPSCTRSHKAVALAILKSRQIAAMDLHSNAARVCELPPARAALQAGSCKVLSCSGMLAGKAFHQPSHS